jgi:hypothetical protein
VQVTHFAGGSNFRQDPSLPSFFSKGDLVSWCVHPQMKLMNSGRLSWKFSLSLQCLDKTKGQECLSQHTSASTTSFILGSTS